MAACVATGAITSLDLITAVPGQDVLADLRAAVETGVDHIYAYTLTIEPDTPVRRSARNRPLASGTCFGANALSASLVGGSRQNITAPPRRTCGMAEM